MKGKVVEFPLKLKNNLKMVQYVGNVRFAPGEIKEINIVIYNRHKNDFDNAMAWMVGDGVSALELVSQKTEITAEIKEETPQETPSKESLPIDKDANEVKSVIKRFATNEIHWRTAIKEIQEIQNVDELKLLYQEGLDLDLDKDSAVMKAILSEIKTLEIFG